MTANIYDERRAVWSRFWASGALHSCSTSYRDNYGGSIGVFWRGVFAALPDSSRVLDIATGNGALPRLLLDGRPATAINCDAVDMAHIEPSWLQSIDENERARIRFHSGVAAEALPFTDAAFSLVVSQYGIEYADLSRAVPEVHRVLAPGGIVRMVIHHAESRPVQLAGIEISHIDWLLEKGNLLDLTAEIVPLIARASTPSGRSELTADPYANQVRARFNTIQEAVSMRMAVSSCPDVLHEVREAVGGVFHIATARGIDSAKHALFGIRSRLVDSRLRLDELRRHALDEGAVLRLCEKLAPQGYGVTHAPLSDAGHLLGWAICVDPVV